MAAITPATGKDKLSLKDVFGDVGTIIYSATDSKITTGAITLPTDGVEFPCAADSLNMSQSAPTINHYKIIGMQGDWFTTSQPGDLEFSLEIPTKHTDILEVLYGEDAVKEIYVGTSASAKTWEGAALQLKETTIVGTLWLVNKEENQIMILNNVKMWATPTYENPGTEPFKFTLTGSIETAGSDDTANIAWLKKAEASSSED